MANGTHTSNASPSGSSRDFLRRLKDIFERGAQVGVAAERAHGTHAAKFAECAAIDAQLLDELAAERWTGLPGDVLPLLATALSDAFEANGGNV